MIDSLFSVYIFRKNIEGAIQKQKKTKLSIRHRIDLYSVCNIESGKHVRAS